MHWIVRRNMSLDIESELLVYSTLRCNIEEVRLTFEEPGKARHYAKCHGPCSSGGLCIPFRVFRFARKRLI